MALLSKKESLFLRSHDLCRLATASKDGTPHLTPVVYALDKDRPVIAIDYGTKKLKNLRENPRVALLVDEYRPNKGLLIIGGCEVHERGKEYLGLRKILYEKFEYYRKNPWEEGESPILRVIPEKAVSWSLK